MFAHPEQLTEPRGQVSFRVGERIQKQDRGFYDH